MGGSSLLRIYKALHIITPSSSSPPPSPPSNNQKVENLSSCAAESNEPQRFNREEHALPDFYDRLFSPWKVLVGPTDWRDHRAGVEGAAKYLLHNVPTHNGPGVYELGISEPTAATSGRATRSSTQPREENTVIAYVGQAENIRSRLQHYGRCGSHLEGGLGSHLEGALDTPANLHPCLFTEAFSRGYSVVFRWASAKSKADAQAIESGLLKRFDYAWNKKNNVKRRSGDMFVKMQQLVLMKSPKESSMFRSILSQSKAGHSVVSYCEKQKPIIKVIKMKVWNSSKSSMHTLSNVQSTIHAELEALPWIPLPSMENGKAEIASKEVALLREKAVNVGYKKIGTCGAVDAQGVACLSAPKQGSKRCETHKGMRVSHSRSMSKPLGSQGDGKLELKQDAHKKAQSRSTVNCNYGLEYGSKCMVGPQKDRKRYVRHKGRHMTV